jgi:hypothetical protein
LVIVTVQISTPPPPLEEPSHWVIDRTGDGEIDVVVVQVPAPAATGPAAPVHTVKVTVEGDDGSSAPLPVT